jgi:pimeloyl-ACP methyl ester carboxylesterase
MNRTLIFHHGLCGDSAQPAEVFPAGIGWHCLTPEARGHGKTPTGPYDELFIPTFTGDLIKTIQAPAVIGGISMGAAIALRLAVERPDLVQALILARPAWLAEDNPPNLAANALAGDLLRRYPPAEALAHFNSHPLTRQLAAESPDNLESLQSCFTRQPIETTAELLVRISASGPGVTPAQIRNIQVPTLVLATARDFVHPIPMARELAALIPNAQYVELTPKSANRAQYLDDFRAAISSFLVPL